MKKTRFLFFIVLLLGQLTAFSQDFSNKGSDFWLCFPTHVPSGTDTSSLAKMSLFLTSDQNSSGTITVGSFSTTFTVTANQVTSGIGIPYSVAHILYSEAGSPVKNKGIHVQVDNGKPAVVLYAHIYAAARSEASLILPTNVLGKQYYSMDYIQNVTRNPDGSTFASQFNVIAVEANTSVRYQLRRDGVLDNTSTTVTLQDVGDILEIQNTQDLTGSIIESVTANGQACKKIAVFSGSSAVNIGYTIGNSTLSGSSTDPLFQQCYPVNTWGKNFGVVPFVADNKNFQYRVLASQDNTTVTIDGTNVTLNAGQYYPAKPTSLQQTPVAKPFMISSDKPICVAEYMISSNLNTYGNGIGDPEMVILNPVEQNISNISVFSSIKQAISAQYLNVFAKYASIGSFHINGAAPKGTFVRMPSPNQDYAYLIENLTPYNTSSYQLTCDTGFNAICYGIGSVESYGYSAGTSLRDFTPVATFQNPYGRIDSAVTCVNSPLKFSVPLTFVPASLSWDFSAAPNISPGTTVTPANVTADSTKTVNGQTLNYYGPGITYIFTKANTPALRDTIKLYTTSATPDGCGSTSQLYAIPVKVNDLPIAKFMVTNSGCVTDSIHLSDKSTYANGLVSRWLWNFGDGSSDDRSSNADFAKKYASGGSYTVKLKVISDIGCASDSVTQTINITAKPVAKFTFSTVLCPNSDIVFTDASTSSIGAIAKWTWNLDDGAGFFTNTTNASPKTQYAVYGTKNPVLVVETGTGCKSDTFAPNPQLKINPLPVVGFILPEVCLNDANAAFTDTTTIAEGSLASYLWNFNAGSPAVSPGPDITSSTVKNPQVKYNKSDNYKVSLTVTSALGCVATGTEAFTVNGTTPKADFSFANAAPYCGTRPVLLKNNSTVDFGNLTKLEIYWDLANNPTVMELDDNPAPGKVYPHAYPDLQSSTGKVYTIKLVAYSGGSTCTDFITKAITVYPQPKAAFSVSPSQLCSGDNVLFTDKSTSISSAESAWSWQFGDGNISAAQNPVNQYNDSGSATASFYFYNKDGCISDTATQQLTIYPNPKVVLQHTAKVLAGGTLQIIPQYVYGTNLQYLWSPATYLNSDTAMNPVSIPGDDITYKLTLTANGGCMASDTVFVNVLKGPVVPNVFSPNGDGINDTWNITYLDSYPGATIDVYNRYGQAVYHSVGYSVNWDGTYHGSPLPVGTYYYIINPKNGRQVISGSVTIIK